MYWRAAGLASNPWRYDVFALVAGVFGFVGVAFAVGRRSVLGASEHAALRELGMTRVQRASVLVGQTSLIAVLGAVLGVLLAIAASPLMPIGLGRTAEPNPGIDVDATVLGVGFVGTFVCVLALGFDRRALRARAQRGTDDGAGSIGAAGAVVGVAGVTAVIVVGASLSRLVADQRAWGWNFDTHSSLTAEQLTADGDVAAAVTAEFVNLSIEGRLIQTITFAAEKGRIDPTIVNGRVSRAPSARGTASPRLGNTGCPTTRNATGLLGASGG